MSTAVGAANVLLGTIYVLYGCMTVLDLKRSWRVQGLTHLGAAWPAMAFTCGPHHLDHGLHVLIAGRTGGSLDLVTLLVGLPPGITWVLLRIEAMFGGPGDRPIEGTPWWLAALPIVGAGYAALVLTELQRTFAGDGAFPVRILPNIALVGLYAAIGTVLFQTQVRNHQVTGRWSVAGSSLGLVLLSCSVMHGVFAVYAAGGRYDLDWHGLTIDLISVPAAAYFLWVTYALTRGWLRDWNEPEGGLGVEAGAPVAVGTVR